MFKTIFSALLALSVLLGGTIEAKESAASHASKVPSPEALKAAYELFDALKLKEGIHNALMQSLQLQLKRQPAMEPYRDIYRDAFEKYARWEDMKQDLAKLYARAFTAEELKQLTNFYSTDLGKKSLALLPRLSQMTMLLAQKRIAAHAEEIKKAVAQRAKKLEASAKKAAAKKN